MINTALIGYGSAAQTFHLPLIRSCPDLCLTALVSRQSGLAFNGITQYPDTSALLADADIRLAVITTPNHTHYPIAKQCLEAGKHVVLEKPMTLTRQDAQNLFDIARERNLILSVFHNRRLDGDYLTVKKLLQEKRLGDIRTARMHWDRYRPVVRARWREDGSPGSGIWYDLAPHLLDQTLQLFGMPEAVSACIRPIRPQSHSPDYAHVQLHYPEREILLHTSPYHAAPTPRFILEGEYATFVKYGLDPQETQLKNGMTPQDPTFGTEAPEHYGTLHHPDGTQEKIPTARGRFADYYPNVAAAIRDNAPLAVQPHEAIAVMQLLEYAQRSAQENRTLFIE